MNSRIRYRNLFLTTKTRRNKGAVFSASLRLRGHFLSTVFFVLGLSLLSAFGDAWPTYHGGADLRGFSAAEFPEKPTRLWSYNTTGTVESTPVSDGERIFVTAGKGRIIALSLEGEKRWEKTFTRTTDTNEEKPLRFDAPMLCHDGVVFAGASRGILLALDAETGDEKWRIDMGGILLGSPNLIDDTHLVLLDQGSGALHAIALDSGKISWTTEGVERCDGSPGVGNDQIAFGSCLAALHIYSATNGTHLRNIEVGADGEIAGGVAIDGKQAFFGTRDGRLICANLEKGTVVWTADEATDQAFSTPALSEKRVVYSSDDGFVYAVDRKIGRTIWKYDTSGYPTSPVIAGDKVLVSADGELLILKLADGALLSQKAISDEITSPAIVKTFAVVGADDGTVSAWGSEAAREE